MAPPVPNPPKLSSTSSIRALEEEDGNLSDGDGEEVRQPKAKRKKTSLEASDKLHSCDFEACTKSFSRPDHLQRHKLNHNPTTIYECDRCPKRFVRSDLLLRHTERHDKRQAGDAPPKPVRRASKPTTTSAPATNKDAVGPVASGSGSWPSVQQVHQPGGGQPIFYGYDAMGTTTNPASLVLSPNAFSPHGVSPHNSTSYPSPHTTDHIPFVNSIGIPTFEQGTFFDNFPASEAPLPGFEEPLKFIQASYGAPFVSASEYDWLFGNTSFDITLGSSRPASPAPADELIGGMSPGVGQTLEEASRGFEYARMEIGARGFIAAGDEAWSGAMSEELPGRRAAELAPPTPQDSATVRHPERAPSRSSSASGSLTATATLLPHQLLHPRDHSTFVSSATRLRILDYLGPEWIGLRGDSRMSCEALEGYLYLFWTRIHETQAPCIHRASFNTETAHVPLILAMVLLGTYFAEMPEAHQLAVKIHPGFRGKVFCSTDFRPRAEIWLHQTALLLIVFGKLCSNRMAHEMSHIFWSSVVTLGRRSALFSQRTMTVTEHSDDVQARWDAWIEEESAKRIAHVEFAVDVEHAALFRHSPALSAFQIQLTLPCEEELWDATNAEEWACAYSQARAPIPFISALKASLMPGHAPPVLNPFSRIAILHGLLSVAQDLQWRDHVIGLSQPEGRANNWRDMISASYNSWKSRLDTCLVTAPFAQSQMLRASISLYAVAHVTLSIDIHELQIFAGAENALGLVVSPAVQEATKVRIRVWAASKDGRAATWHAAHFLRSSLEHYLSGTGDLAACLHHGWSVYIACLTLYCFGVATSGPPGPREPDHRAATMTYLDSMCTATPEGLLAVSKKNNVLPLCESIIDYICDSRWEIAQEGSKILHRLVFR